MSARASNYGKPNFRTNLDALIKKNMNEALKGILLHGKFVWSQEYKKNQNNENFKWFKFSKMHFKNELSIQRSGA